jgi:PIN domain nuclease of toxin-antitoxin system
MRYFIDSNILFFYAVDPGELTREVKDILRDYGNQIYIPSRCVEELVHLRQSGKITPKMWKSAEDILHTITDEFGFGIKYVAKEHLLTLAHLPLLPDHKDPTDRIAIAQAITEKTPLISSDREFPRYKRFGLDLVFNRR